MNIILKGRGASEGVIKGEVIIVKSKSEIEKMVNGKVLVIPFADSSFASAMQKAIGIITDNGGVTCHVSIIARELGIPAVVGTNKATKKLKDDMEVVVDGTKGIVYI